MCNMQEQRGLKRDTKKLNDLTRKTLMDNFSLQEFAAQRKTIADLDYQRATTKLTPQYNKAIFEKLTYKHQTSGLEGGPVNEFHRRLIA